MILGTWEVTDARGVPSKGRGEVGAREKTGETQREGEPGVPCGLGRESARGPEAAVSSVPQPLGTGHAEQTSRHWGVRGLQDTGGAARQSGRSEHNTAQASCLHGRAGTPPGVPEPGDGLRTLPPSAPAACSEITF